MKSMRQLLATLVLVLASIPHPLCAQSRNDASYLFVLKEKAVFKNRSTVNGNVAVTHAGGYLSLGRGTRFTGQTQAVADRAKLGAGSQVFDLFTNDLRHARTGVSIVGTLTTPVPPPVFVSEPLLLPDPFDPANFPAAFPVQCGGQNVRGKLGEAFDLAPGTYDKVVVARGGRLTLHAGTYNFCSLRAVRADVAVTGPVTLNVHDRLVIGGTGSLVPVGAGLSADDVQINVEGRGVRVGPRATFNARVFAPHATLAIGRQAHVVGHFVARKLGSDARFSADPPRGCGDGVLSAGETCEPPGVPEPPNQQLCRSDCTFCGDGVVNGGEECDDGNSDPDDGCDNDCLLAPLPQCALEVTKSCAVLPPPPMGSDCQGGVVSMKLEYTGEGCAATTNDQGGKAQCSGDPALAAPVAVVLTGDPSVATVSPTGEVLGLGDVVTITATGQKLRADTGLAIEQGGATLQSLSIHTSCSQPLNVGDQFGSLRLVELTSRNGGTVTLPPPPVPAAQCELTGPPPPPHCKGGVTALALRYIGGDCTISPNDQSGKATCSGNAGAAEPVEVVLVGGPSDAALSPTGEVVGIGDLVIITATDNTLDSATELEIRQGGAVLQSISIHTSCSQPLNLGDRFGGVEVVGMATTDGGEVWAGSPVQYTYEVTNTSSAAVTDVAVVDDELGEVPGSPVSQIDPGETVTLEATAFITEDTINVATVTGDLVGDGLCEAMDSAQVTVVPPPPLPVSCTADSKLASMTLRYTGEGCAASDNPQGGKATCTGDAAFTSPVRILVRDAKKANIIYADQSGVQLGGSVAAAASNAGKTKLGAQTLVRTFNTAGALVEEDAIHTSCSQPLAVGDHFGSFEVVGLELTPGGS